MKQIYKDKIPYNRDLNKSKNIVKNLARAIFHFSISSKDIMRRVCPDPRDREAYINLMKSMRCETMSLVKMKQIWSQELPPNQRKVLRIVS